MSFESQEERITRLEKQVMTLTKLIGDVLNFAGDNAKFTLASHLLLCEGLLKENVLVMAMGRVVSLDPATITPAMRQQFIDMIAKGETGNDNVAALIATVKAKLNEPPLLPPLPPGATGF